MCILVQLLLCIVLHIRYHIAVLQQLYNLVLSLIYIVAGQIENIVVRKQFDSPRQQSTNMLILRAFYHVKYILEITTLVYKVFHIEIPNLFKSGRAFLFVCRCTSWSSRLRTVRWLADLLGNLITLSFIDRNTNLTN